jgi:hypothetical protein
MRERNARVPHNATSVVTKRPSWDDADDGLGNITHRRKTDDGLTGILPDESILHDILRLDRLLPHFLNRNQGTVGNPIARS